MSVVQKTTSLWQKKDFRIPWELPKKIILWFQNFCFQMITYLKISTSWKYGTYRLIRGRDIAKKNYKNSRYCSKALILTVFSFISASNQSVWSIFSGNAYLILMWSYDIQNFEIRDNFFDYMVILTNLGGRGGGSFVRQNFYFKPNHS